MRRPAPYVPLSVTFATGKTGTAILDTFGAEGLGVWAAIIAAAKAGNPEGQILLLHENDWATLGLAVNPPTFPLQTFLTFLGRHKQTRTTRQGRVMYVQLTRWGEWNDAKNSYLAAQRSARKRAKTIRDDNRDAPRDAKRTRTVTEKVIHSDTELELDLEKRRTKPKAVALNTDEPPWPPPHEPDTNPETNGLGLTLHHITPELRSI